MGQLVNLTPNLNLDFGQTKLQTWMYDGLLNVHIHHVGQPYDEGYYTANKNLQNQTRVADTLYFLNNHSEYTIHTPLENGFVLHFKLKEFGNRKN